MDNPEKERMKKTLVALKEELDTLIARGEVPDGALMVYNQLLLIYKNRYGTNNKCK